MKYQCLPILIAAALGCSDEKAPTDKSGEPLFRLVSKTESGVTFENSVHDLPYGNILIYQYFYN